MIEDILKNQIKVYINNAIINGFKKYILNKPEINYNIINLLNKKESIINLEKSNIFFNHNYSLVANMINIINKFILYPYNFHNLNIIKNQYHMYINTNIIKYFYNADTFIISNNGKYIINNLIVNYNYPVLNKLKEDIDLRNYDNLLDILIEENKNNLSKIFNNCNNCNNLNDIFDNIDGFLYNNIIDLLKNEDIIGNNILLHLKESFHLSTYLILKLLTRSIFENNNNNNYIFSSYNEHIINYDKLILFNDIKYYILLEKFLDFDNIKKSEKNKIINEILNYDNNIKSKDIYLKNMYIWKIIFNHDYDCKYIIEIDDSIPNNYNEVCKENIEDDDEKIQDPIENDEEDEIDEIDEEDVDDEIIIEKINSIKRILINIQNTEDKNTISNYIDEIKNIIKDNQNDILKYNEIYILELLKFQKKYYEDDDNKNKRKLIKIIDAFEIVSNIAEKYFEHSRTNIENNTLLKSINNELVYISKSFIGKSIEIMMREVLMTYFNNNSSSDYENKYNIINLILTDDIIENSSLLDILYDEICPKIVLNSIEVFNNKQHKYGVIMESVKDILVNYFKLLNNFDEILSEDIINIFINNISSYFDIFITKVINLWFINIENILRFFINNYRCLKTYIDIFE
jgi:hypothetical protein